MMTLANLDPTELEMQELEPMEAPGFWTGFGQGWDIGWEVLKSATIGFSLYAT